MKKTKQFWKLIIISGCFLLLSIALAACYDNETVKVTETENVIESSCPDDFNFRLNFGVKGKNQIDTYINTFTKDLVQDGTKTIDFAVPDNMKSEIYKFMMVRSIFDLPEKLTVEDMTVTPSCDYELTVTANGKTKTIVWNEGFFTSMTDNLPKDNVDFLDVVKYISEYIYSTEEYKNMPKPNGSYE